MSRRVAIITGAASGLGFACAQRFARDGVELFLIDIDADKLNAAASMIEAAPVKTFMCDIRTRSACRDAVDACAQAVIDRLAANAPLSLRAMKALLVREMAFRGGIEHADIDELVQATRASQDAKEGIAARLEKRTPVFTGE